MAIKNNSQVVRKTSVAERLLAIEALGLVRQEKKDPFLDALTQLACSICDSPRAAITILGADDLWIESSINFSETVISKDDSICFHALNSGGTFQVDDLLSDPRFRSSPLVVNEPNIRAYAGAPLISTNGVTIGFLCVLFSRPQKMTRQQIHNLEILAQQAMFIIESRKNARDTVETQQKLEESLFYQKAVLENVPSMIYIKNAKKT